MSNRYRNSSSYENANLPLLSSSIPDSQQLQHIQLKQYNEFQTNYFKIQKLINKKVNLSLKYEQLKTPEIYSTLIKPISNEIISIVKENKTQFTIKNDLKISIFTIYILLLLKYEYLIQSENNLIQYDLLISKSHVCELMSIRMLREYNSYQRVKILFVKPPPNLISSHHKFNFNTLELCVLSKSKNFLSQPIIVQILNRFYNGDLIYDDYDDYKKLGDNANPNSDDNEKLLLKNQHYKYYDGELNKFCATSYNITNINHKLSIISIYRRINVIPKYQNILINLKLIIFAINYFALIQHSEKEIQLNSIEILFWLIGLSFNFEILNKFYHINFKFLNLILWNHIDFVLILIIDFCFILRFFFNNQSYFNDFFSLIGIILFPRILSIFNNYKFFNLIILSFHKMFLNLVGLVLMFFTLISGFYFCFLKLSYNQTPFEILFNMVKVFFGFTPSVWNNWDDFNTLGKIMQMSYLFLLQFIIGTILAICLSGVFNKTRENIEYEFNFFKSNNLIIYFKCSELNQDWNVTNLYCQVFKIPFIVLIFIYEFMCSILVKFKQVFTFKSKKLGIINPSDNEENEVTDLKNFTFLRKPDFDHELNFKTSINLRKRKPKNKIIKNYQSISTLGCNGNHLRTASTDSFFIDQLLNRKYGGGVNNATVNNVTASNDQNLQIVESNRLFSKKYQEQQQQQQKLSKQQSNQLSFKISRHNPNLQTLQPQESYIPQTIPSSLSAIQTQQLQLSTSPTNNVNQQILNRLLNLENLLIKKITNEDSKSDEHRLNQISQLNQIKGIKTIESDNLSINSDSDTEIDSILSKQQFEIGNIYEEEEVIQNGEDDLDDLDEEEEFDRTLPMRFNGFNDNNDQTSDFDQYDGEGTY
ncbi:hypothetical protein KGF54_003253 [Candida jiufengensis]|uniref:uncharacterized protein n=1 Tax=Candida jiufengensis TaxID=497108 RepID=UPI0022250F88|nr:uncharacterized protein KGF54_003253 [Candida jiufengensis]KAI5952386.1 hypothetical protein KGF54_003253 [Candida jiufengensis]